MPFERDIDEIDNDFINVNVPKSLCMQKYTAFINMRIYEQLLTGIPSHNTAVSQSVSESRMSFFFSSLFSKQTEKQRKNVRRNLHVCYEHFQCPPSHINHDVPCNQKFHFELIFSLLPLFLSSHQCKMHLWSRRTQVLLLHTEHKN